LHCKGVNWILIIIKGQQLQQIHDVTTIAQNQRKRNYETSNYQELTLTRIAYGGMDNQQRQKEINKERSYYLVSS
jgi:hypothetical protein